jgi:hypothetical protein
MTPSELPGAPGSPGPPGSLDLKHWDDACGFTDGYADYGRWAELWVDTARAPVLGVNAPPPPPPPCTLAYLAALDY